MKTQIYAAPVVEGLVILSSPIITYLINREYQRANYPVVFYLTLQALMMH